VNSGKPCAIAVAAISASYARAADFRPDARSDATTVPERTGVSIEGDGVEVRLGLLPVGMPGSAAVPSTAYSARHHRVAASSARLRSAAPP
jgi:hypothetical protein